MPIILSQSELISQILDLSPLIIHKSDFTFKISNSQKLKCNKNFMR